jgi:hypothetical protein
MLKADVYADFVNFLNKHAGILHCNCNCKLYCIGKGRYGCIRHSRLRKYETKNGHFVLYCWKFHAHDLPRSSWNHLSKKWHRISNFCDNFYCGIAGWNLIRMRYMVLQLEEVSCVSPDSAQWWLYLQFFKWISSEGFSEWISIASVSCTSACWCLSQANWFSQSLTETGFFSFIPYLEWPWQKIS